MSRGPYDLEVLVDAVVARHRWAGAAPELADHLEAREGALRAAFEESPDRRGDPPDAAFLFELFEETVARILALSDPWDAFLEPPDSGLRRRAHGLLDAPREAYAEALRSYAAEVLGRLLGLPPGVRVTRQEVIAAAGHDPAAPGPDPLDHL